MRRLALCSGGLFILLVAILRFAAWQTEAWWFDSVGYAAVFSKITMLRGALFLGAFAFCFAVLWLSWRHIPHSALEIPADWRQAPGEAETEPTHFPSTGQLKASALTVALLIALGCSLWASASWTYLLLFLNAIPAGPSDPVFGLNLGFWLFRLPFWQFGHAFVSSILWLALLGAALLYELTHDIALGERNHRLSPRALKHLTSLGTVLLLWKALGLRLYALGLLVSDGSLVSGAGYTDIHARLPLTVIAFFVTLLAAAMIWRAGRAGNRRKARKIILGYVAASLITGIILPAAVQRWRVAPAELELETPYIQRMMAASNQAYSLGRIAAVGDSPPTDSVAFARAARGMPLWPPEALRQILNQAPLSAVPLAPKARPQDDVGSLHLDRYLIDGEWRLVFAGVRDAASTDAEPPINSWQHRHLEDIHGDGLVLCDANRTLENGAPILYTRKLGVAKSQIYFGLFPEAPPVVARLRNGLPPAGPLAAPSAAAPFSGGISEPFADYVITNGAGKAATSEAVSPAGIALDSARKRWLMALRFGDWQLATDSHVNEGSRLIWYRRVRERCRRIAPFLDFPEDPYPVAANGRIVWMLDGFSASRSYPYSQPDSAGDGARNYYRNSVKATVDAFDGSVKFYVSDRTDPIIEVWQRIFPGLFLQFERMPAALRRHCVYPGALLEAQAATRSQTGSMSVGAYYTGRRHRQILATSFALLPHSEHGVQFATIAPILVVSSNSDSDSENVSLTACLVGSQAGLSEWRAPGRGIDFDIVKQQINDTPAVAELLQENRIPVTSPFAFAPIGDRLLVGYGLMRDNPDNWLSVVKPTGPNPARLDTVALWLGQGETSHAWSGDTLEAALASTLAELKPAAPAGQTEPASSSLTPSDRLNLVRQQFGRLQDARTAGNWPAYEKAEAEMRRLLKGDIPRQAASGPKQAAPKAGFHTD